MVNRRHHSPSATPMVPRPQCLAGVAQALGKHQRRRSERVRETEMSKYSRNWASSPAARPSSGDPPRGRDPDAVGEFLPIVAIAILLSANGAFLGLISLVVIAGVALLLTFFRVWCVMRRSGGSSPRVSARHRRPRFAGPIFCFSLCWWSLRISGSTWCSGPSSPVWCCALGAGRCALLGGQARCGGLRLLHPGLLRDVGYEPRPALDHPGTGPAGRFLRSVPRRSWPPRLAVQPVRLGLVTGVAVDLKRAADLYAQGRSLRQIGAALGVHWAAVSQQLQKAGVTMRRGAPPTRPRFHPADPGAA